MLKGTLGLIIRYALYAIGAGLAGAGVAAQTIDGTQLCLDMKATADLAATAIMMIFGGSATFIGTAIWSRIVKRDGGVT